MRWGVGMVGIDDVRDLVHGLAEHGGEERHIHLKLRVPGLPQVGIVALGYQRPGVPQGTVDVENQMLDAHSRFSSR